LSNIILLEKLNVDVTTDVLKIGYSKNKKIAANKPCKNLLDM